MLSRGVMAQGGFICVNQGFATELEMRVHWDKCYMITLTEELNMFVVPDSSKEPA